MTAPGAAHGVDVDEDGDGVLREGRLYQLVRATTPSASGRSRSRSSGAASRWTRASTGPRTSRRTRSTTEPVCSSSTHWLCRASSSSSRPDREPVVVLTAPWHERDTHALVERLGVTVYAPPPDTAADLMRKFGITAEQAGDGSPDLVWLRAGDAVEWHPYAAGDRLPIGIQAFPGREHNDLVLWIESRSAVVAGDTLADFGRGFEMPREWLREGVTSANRSPRECGHCSRCRSARPPGTRRTDGPRCARARALLPEEDERP